MCARSKAHKGTKKKQITDRYRPKWIETKEKTDKKHTEKRQKQTKTNRNGKFYNLKIILKILILFQKH